MEGEYTKEIKKIGIYSFLLFIILAVFYFFSNILDFARSNIFLNENVAGPIKNFIYLIKSEPSIVVSALLIIGVIITIILSLLIARQMLKLTKRIL